MAPLKKVHCKVYVKVKAPRKTYNLCVPHVNKMVDELNQQTISNSDKVLHIDGLVPNPGMLK